jgi:hypothetical protein
MPVAAETPVGMPNCIDGGIAVIPVKILATV